MKTAKMAIRKNTQVIVLFFLAASIAIIASCFCLPNSAYAGINLTTAAVGNTVPTAENVVFGVAYTGGWNKNTDHLNCYSRLTVEKRGTVTMTVSKPFDSEGEYGKMSFDLSNEDGDYVWWEKVSDLKMKSGSTNYKYSFNLDPGIYIMNMTPEFVVISGIITFTYKFEFEANPYVITEPNGDTSQASILKEGHVYSGYFGSNYTSHGDNNECMVFTAPKAAYYDMKIGCFDALNATTWIGKYTVSGQEEKSIDNFDKIDSKGYHYKAIYLKKGQRCYLRYYNYSNDQISYKVAVIESKTDPRYALLRSNGAIYKCSCKGKSTGKKLDYNDKEEVTTLYIDPAVKRVPSKVKCAGNSYSIGIHFSNLKTVSFLTNSKGKNACKAIGNSAFNQSEKLAVVKNLQKTSVKTIGYMAFWKCKNLKSISLPKTFKKAGWSCFEGCKRLKTIGGISKKKAIMLLAL